MNSPRTNSVAFVPVTSRRRRQQIVRYCQSRFAVHTDVLLQGLPGCAKQEGRGSQSRNAKNEDPDNRGSSCTAGSLLDSINRPDGSARRQVSPRYCWLRLHQLKRERPDPEPALGVGFRGDRRSCRLARDPQPESASRFPPLLRAPLTTTAANISLPHSGHAWRPPTALPDSQGACRCALGACLRSCRRPSSPLATGAPSASARAACP